MIPEILGGLIVPVAGYIGTGLTVRAMARKPVYYILIPGNCFTILVGDDNETGEMTDGGGGVVDVLHDVPGHILNKSHHDKMQWRFESGVETALQQQLMYRLYNVQTMKLWREPRTNVEKRRRLTRETGGEELKILTKDKKPKFVFFSGEEAVTLRESDTKDKLGVDLEIIYAYERTYPVRSVLYTADPISYIGGLIKAAANRFTGTHDTGEFLGGDNSRSVKRELEEYIQEQVGPVALNLLGFTVKAITLSDVPMTEEHLKILRLEAEATKKAASDLVTAKNKQVMDLLEVDVEAARIEKIVLPTAKAGWQGAAIIAAQEIGKAFAAKKG